MEKWNSEGTRSDLERVEAENISRKKAVPWGVGGVLFVAALAPVSSDPEEPRVFISERRPRRRWGGGGDSATGEEEEAALLFLSALTCKERKKESSASGRDPVPAVAEIIREWSGVCASVTVKPPPPASLFIPEPARRRQCRPAVRPCPAYSPLPKQPHLLHVIKLYKKNPHLLHKLNFFFQKY